MIHAWLGKYKIMQQIFRNMKQFITKKTSMYLLEWEKTPTSWNGEGGDHGESGSMQKVKIERQQPVSIQECLRPRCNSSIGDKESVATSKKGEVLLSQVNRVKRLVKQAEAQ